MEEKTQEVFVSVDVETAGPNPSQYALLSIGACFVSDPARGFYVELKPTSLNTTTEALTTHNLSLEHLMETGLPPAEAMSRFETWLSDEIPTGNKPIFVAFNAPFDWMFVNDYFHRFLGRNPFGHSALDIKAFYMGSTRISWSQTAMKHIGPRFIENFKMSHHALQDARDQAALFQAMLREYYTDTPK
jgi:ribonuclease T